MIAYYYPHPLEKLVAASDEIIIEQTEPSWSEEGPKLKSSTYEFLPETDGYNAVKKVFNKYSYHRNLRSLPISNEINGVMRNYNIYEYKDNEYVNIFMNEAGEIVIDQHRYKIGF